MNFSLCEKLKINNSLCVYKIKYIKTMECVLVKIPKKNVKPIINMFIAIRNLFIALNFFYIYNYSKCV